MNKVLLPFMLCILNANITPDNLIENVLLKGKYDVEISQEFFSNHASDPEIIFLKGMLEINGDKSKDYFVSYLNKNPEKYVDDAIMKVGDFYYCEGAYIQASEWYKRITMEYPSSKYIDTAISYFLNSLIITGKKDTATYYSNYFNSKYDNININNAYVKPKKKNFYIKNTTKTSHKLSFSVQVASFSNYQSAKKMKKILSREGFLCRIDEMKKNLDSYYSVRIGNFKSKSLAIKEQKRLKSRIGIYDSIIVKID